MTGTTDHTSPSEPGACACPRLDLDAWNQTHLCLNARPFLVRRIAFFFRVPVGLREEIAALRRKAQALKLGPSRPPMLLQRARGLFKGELLLGIDQDIGRDECEHLTGKYLASLHRGPYERLGRARKTLLAAIARDMGVTPGEVLLWYVNCPACWKADGGPATVLLARIGNPELPSEPPPNGS